MKKLVVLIVGLTFVSAGLVLAGTLWFASSAKENAEAAGWVRYTIDNNEGQQGPTPAISGAALSGNKTVSYGVNSIKMEQWTDGVIPGFKTHVHKATAIPGHGWKFVRWEVYYANEWTLTISAPTPIYQTNSHTIQQGYSSNPINHPNNGNPGDYHFRAFFIRESYTLTIMTSLTEGTGIGGYVDGGATTTVKVPATTANGSPASYSANIGTITARANPGYEFVRWDVRGRTVHGLVNSSTPLITTEVTNAEVATVACGRVPVDSSNLSLGFYYTINTEYKAVFKPLPRTINVTVNNGGNGNSVAAAGVGSGFITGFSFDRNFATTVQLTVTPAAGFNFTTTINNTAYSGHPINFNVATTNSIIITFNRISYTLTTSARQGTFSGTAGGGTVTRLPNTTAIAFGTAVTLTATPNTGYVFSNWYNFTDSQVMGHSSQISFPMLAKAVDIRAVFVAQTAARTLTFNVVYCLSNASEPPDSAYVYGGSTIISGVPGDNAFSYILPRRQPLLNNDIITYNGIDFRIMYLKTWEGNTETKYEQSTVIDRTITFDFSSNQTWTLFLRPTTNLA